MPLALVGQLCCDTLPLAHAHLLLFDCEQSAYTSCCDENGYYFFCDLKKAGHYTLYYAMSPINLTSLDIGVMEQYCSFEIPSSCFSQTHDIGLTYCLKPPCISPLLTLHLSTPTEQYINYDFINFTLTATNTSTIPLSDISFHQLFDMPLSFVEHSLCINKQCQPNCSLLGGIIIGHLLPGETITITFDAQVTTSTALSITPFIHAYYSYEIPTASQKLTEHIQSPCVMLSIMVPSIHIDGFVSPNVAFLRDSLSFHFIITNNGSLDLLNLSLKQCFSGVAIIDDSLFINHQKIPIGCYDAPILLGYLGCGEQLELSFEGQVLGSINYDEELTYIGYYSFMYHQPFHPPGYIKDFTYTLHMPLMPTLFKQVILENVFTLKPELPDLSHIHTVDLSITFINSKIIETPLALGLDGNELTGYQLIFHGLCNYKLTYISPLDTHTLIPCHYQVPFSSFITLPRDTNPTHYFHLNYKFEDHFALALNNRCFLVNSYILFYI